MLYIRMLLIMVVSLYTSRVILRALGVEDFGLYNVVGGVVILFSFINNAMVASTQRFLNFEIGRNNVDEAQNVFSACLNIHIIIAILFLILSETVGLWFLNNYIQIPNSREMAANWVYQFSIISTILGIIRSPYNAAIIAHEHMSFYAYVSIVEVLLKLVIVYLVCQFADRLVAYAFFLMVVSLIILGAYYVFCRKKYSICKYKFEHNKKRYLSLASFSAWSLFGSMANVTVSQGVNIILNIFFGVAVNAAMGIANQVNAAVYQFVNSFQTAFNPQIVKSYAANDKVYFTNLIMNTSRYSFLLLSLLSFPVYICCPEILKIWLGTPPEYAVEFCRLMLLFSLIDAIQGPLWMAVQAIGNIRNYQILISVLVLLNLPITYIFLISFKKPEIALIVRVSINIITAAARVLYLNHMNRFPIGIYMKEVVLKCIVILLVSYPIPYMIHKAANTTFVNCLFNLSASLLCIILAIALIGLNFKERALIIRKVRLVIKNVF